jgi:parallel beta-helix repeat protein
VDGNPQNDGVLLAVRGCNGITLSGCEFTEGYRGVAFDTSSNVTIANNNVHLMRCDGFDLASVQNVVIQGNHIGGFLPVAGDHPDAIQFWTTNQTVGSSHITISDNVIKPPMGAGNQGIFMSDEVGTLPYQDVTITNNLLYSNGGEWHGIYANHFIGATISNNTVVSTTTDTMKYWIDIVNSQNLDVISNVTDRIITSNSTDIRFADNIDFTLTPSATALISNLDLGYLTTESDLLVSGHGYQPSASQSDGTGGAGGTVVVPENLVYGTVGSDTVQGTAGKDKIWGVGANDSVLGRGTVDKLWGTGGTDTFVLGDSRGRFYDDGKSKSAGKGDYAQVMDFVAGDHIQLHGSMAEYLMKAGSVGGVNGLQIFFDSNANGKIDSRDELIGHVVGVASLSPDAFVFG